MSRAATPSRLAVTRCISKPCYPVRRHRMASASWRFTSNRSPLAEVRAETRGSGPTELIKATRRSHLERLAVAALVVACGFVALFAHGRSFGAALGGSDFAAFYCAG